MHRIMRTAGVLALVFGGVARGILAADAVPLDQVPPVVRAALEKRFAAARSIDATREDRNDYAYFFVTLREKPSGTAVSVTITENGDITKVEPATPPPARPAAANPRE